MINEILTRKINWYKVIMILGKRNLISTTGISKCMCEGWVAGASPEVFTDVATRGPVASIISRARGWSGIRMATVGRSARTMAGTASRLAGKTRLSGPGQWASIGASCITR